MKTTKAFALIFYLSLFHINFATNVTKLCESMDVIKDDKCYKLIESQTYNHEDSLKACKTVSSIATLVSIETVEEQLFLDNYIFKNRSIVDSVWIGATPAPVFPPMSEFIWENGAKMSFTNWDKGNHFNITYTCVEMQSDVTNSLKLGKWLSVPCEKKNVALCQIYNSKVIANSDLEIKFVQLHKEVKQFMISMNKFRTVVNQFMQTSSLDLIPIDFIYTQLPNQTEPKQLWPKYEWIEISRHYGGLFFRVLGEGSASFGSIQNASSPLISEIEGSKNSCGDHISGLKVNDWSDWVRTGGSGSSGNECLRFKMSSAEVRPINKAIRLWKRVK